MKRLMTWGFIISLLANAVFILDRITMTLEMKDVIAVNKTLKKFIKDQEVLDTKKDEKHRAEVFSMTENYERVLASIDTKKKENERLKVSIADSRKIRISPGTWETKFDALDVKFEIAMDKIQVQQDIIKKFADFRMMVLDLLDLKEEINWDLKKTRNQIMAKLKVSVENTDTAIKIKEGTWGLGVTAGGVKTINGDWGAGLAVGLTKIIYKFRRRK